MSGFVSPVSWRWAFWIGLAIAGVSFVPIAFLPETFAPVILRRRSRKSSKAMKNVATPAGLTIERHAKQQLTTAVLTRPLRMLFTEPIVLFSCLYLSFATGIFCMYKLPKYTIIADGFHSPLLRGLPVDLPRNLWHEFWNRRTCLPT